MSNPFSNIWFSALATVVAAWFCYDNIDNLGEQWVGVLYLVVLTLNTVLLVMSRIAAKAVVTDQRDNQNLTRQEE